HSWSTAMVKDMGASRSILTWECHWHYQGAKHSHPRNQLLGAVTDGGELALQPADHGSARVARPAPRPFECDADPGAGLDNIARHAFRQHGHRRADGFRGGDDDRSHPY